MTSKQLRDLDARIQVAIVKHLAALVGKLLTIQDICAKLGVHESTFYRRRKVWKFPRALINEGKFVRWTSEQLADWQLSHLQKNSDL